MCRKRNTENTKGTGGKKIWRPKTTPQGGKDEAAPPSIPQRTETEKEDNKRDKENVEAKNPENSDDSGFLEISKKKAARRSLEGTEGDFNTVLKQDEKIGGNPVSWEEVRPFQDCLNLCGLEDLPFEGPRFTWTNNQDYDKRIYSKLDRVLGNINWMCNFDYKVYFKERGISDHSPMIIQKMEQFKAGHHFRFCDMWTLDPQFPLLVADVWDQEHKDYPMYQVIQKLKQLKGPLKKLNKSKFQNLDSQIDQIRTKLHIVQADQRANSSNTNLAKFEKELTQELHQKLIASFLMKCQQSKADWITYGDQDTKLFHAWVKKRRAQTHLTAIAKEDGEVVEGKTKVAKVLVEFYQNQLGRTMETEDINPNIISMGNTLSIDQQLALIAPITPDEIKTSLFEIPNNKSPGPDGFSSGFFKNQWKKENKFLHLTNMRKGSFPFRYLGSPITSSRISAKECEALTEKLTTKLTVWTSKNLSYAGKVKLINSVLYGIIGFWSRLFIIPSMVMKKIQSLCRNFLWGSSQNQRRTPLVAWDDLCLPQQYGGLGLKNLVYYNKASVMKMVWDIALEKEILWIKWIHNRYLKNSDIWECKIKTDDCFYWKKILQTRDCFVEMGRSSSYTTEAGYQWLLGQRLKPGWTGLVWNRLSLPKHKFILWLTYKDKLLTKDRLRRFYPIDTQCLLCSNGEEDRHHLFCNCPYTRELYKKIYNWSHQLFEGQTFEEICDQIQKITPTKRRMKQTAVFAACVYYLWKVRNLVFHENSLTPTEEAFNWIRYHVSTFMNAKICSPYVNS
ncbi:unnamed protein product [Cuscuta campestris]|uniref:Reverse transcriptase zinc-binding domain-containing protein n=1 Tax=Cuscuta campestris TaxID=132261 RepID=A0A484LJD2_9ASTE|nr:unnamed protein product [Cuscuta campestris]